ncbi:helix-turn-helix domain-containing protein [Paenibacillus dendritiformis]|uniref:helix-turn-helix domain-containing protein n=1 Tax=Paenibacillus dendritiformis TaxID=130049 RepID=UPI00143CEEED|nr:helix-turn-helix domain-containing protein [Paenibacillus dendritiformis]NKI21476.1 helix-turn-helix domain-containing protein [Paenibacillus dendritiformis]NRF97162.1 helix-turn-helix domain-containing protein [Paenibacillus dendritiformis]
MNDLEKYLGRLYSAEQVAELLNIEMVTCYKWLREGRIKAMKLSGSLWRIREADLLAFIEQAIEEGRR